MNTEGSQIPKPTKKYSLTKQDTNQPHFKRPIVSQLIRKFSSPDLSEDLKNSNNTQTSIIESNIVGARKKSLSPSSVRLKNNTKENGLNEYNQQKYHEAHDKLEHELNKALRDTTITNKKSVDIELKRLSIEDETTEDSYVHVSQDSGCSTPTISKEVSRDLDLFQFDTTPPPPPPKLKPKLIEIKPQQSPISISRFDTSSPILKKSPSSIKSSPINSPKVTHFKVRKFVETTYKKSNLDLTQDKQQQQQLPPQQSPSNPIQINQEKYDLLTTKIIKLQKEINFLNSLLPPHNIDNDFTQRRKLVHAKEQLVEKLEECQKEKYQIGMCISRSWRKQDGNRVTDFWVRSVSG